MVKQQLLDGGDNMGTLPELKLNKQKLIDVVNFLNKPGQASEKLDKRYVLVKSKDNFYVKVEGIHG